MTPKLDVNGVSFSYHTLEGETLALSDISFSLSPGEFAAVVGPSGCGKSTLLSLLCGLSKPDTGQILLDGHPLRQSPSDTGYMLQKDHLFRGGIFYPMYLWDWKSRTALPQRQLPA